MIVTVCPSAASWFLQTCTSYSFAMWHVSYQGLKMTEAGKQCYLKHGFLFLLFRTKIMQNIGIVFVKMGQYSDAITSFEHIMSEAPSFKTGFNLILCYFALGDRDKMKRAFQKLLTVDLKIDDEDKYLPHGVGAVLCLYVNMAGHIGSAL